MLWSLIVTVCLASGGDVMCQEMRWHMIERQAACDRMLAGERRRLEAAGPAMVVARCIEGWFA
ncbi:hypothetical protein [Roseovarius amoyensis]|uniref:hypothetical protein n=1 Tax=Roseovarius amoyensis TaxID=2211448 RepID=UPI000DBE4F92|nr:hypothetical protein [Roseovarius amoyensis]